MRRVGIVGCGVAGLASAVALARRGHAVTLIERAPVLHPIGAGLLLQPSGQMALRALGLLDQVIARAEPIKALHAWTHRRRMLVRLAYRKLDPDLTGYGVHRGDLFQVLHDCAVNTGVNFTLGVTAQSSRQTSDEIFAVDDAGNEHGPFDVLIAADGSKSRLRLAPQLGARVREFPLAAAWFSGRSDAVRGRLHQVTLGTHQLIGLLPVGEGRCSLFCALPRGGKETIQRRGLDVLKQEIAALCPEAESLLGQITSLDDLACGSYQIVRLRQWNAGRLICIGDAAHSTTPHLGQGVNLALLDALSVAFELDYCDDVPTALDCAARYRRAQVMWCWRLSNLLGPLFQNEGRALGIARDIALPWMPRVPGIGRCMVGTMAGLHTGLFTRLQQPPRIRPLEIGRDEPINREPRQRHLRTIPRSSGSRFWASSAAMSLLLCAATIVMWVRSYHHQDRITWLTRAGRQTIRSYDGGLGLFAPGLPAPSATRAAAETRVSWLLKDDLEWNIRCIMNRGYYFPRPDLAVGVYCDWVLKLGIVKGPLPQHSLDEALVPLLSALENPETFVRAHVALTQTYGTGNRVSFETEPWIRRLPPYKDCLANFDGLRLTLHPQERSWDSYIASADIDPAQLPAIREQWHQRLDGRRASIRYAHVAAATSALPLLMILSSLARMVQIRIRRSRNLCPACGYDLRGSPGRCPECGT
ncbi:MAG: Oxidoreductase [Phycisphaerales bacterium]|nr:Oxidoreductase [Phycisphaerales bacterium]